jgi:predicted MPP superfamily phosphohydrolase
MRTRVPRRVGLALGAWAILTAASTAAHRLAWNPSLTNAVGERAEWLIKGADNIFHAASAPIWYSVWRVLGLHSSLATVVAVNLVTWGAVVLIIAALLTLRARLHARPPADPAPRPESAPDLQPADPFRRRFLVDATFLSGSLAVCGMGTSASVFTPWSLVVRRYSVPIRGLPASLDGLRLVQITDTHLGPRIPGAFITEAVDLALSLKPDLFVLTGDYVHDGTRYIDRAASLFAPLTQESGNCLGVVGVLGNHDHYADARAVTAAMRSRAVRMIDNDRLFIDGATRRLTTSHTGGPALCIAGVDDLNTGEVRPDLALGGVHDDMPRIMLAHTPDTAEIPAITGGEGALGPSHRVDLMLSGHTHGGQVRVPLLGTPVTLSRYGQRYAHGLVEGPACPVIISAGVGMSVFPVRFGVPPEIVEITLTRA